MRDFENNVHTMEAFRVYRKTKQNTNACVQRLETYLVNHHLKNDGCTIYGEDGPVFWKHISDHPKVRAKFHRVKLTPPPAGTIYYVPTIGACRRYLKRYWCDSPQDNFYFEHNLVCPVKEIAIEKAELAIATMECSYED
jgi:hypothetical protein